MKTLLWNNKNVNFIKNEKYDRKYICKYHNSEKTLDNLENVSVLPQRMSESFSVLTRTDNKHLGKSL